MDHFFLLLDSGLLSRDLVSEFLSFLNIQSICLGCLESSLDLIDLIHGFLEVGVILLSLPASFLWSLTSWNRSHITYVIVLVLLVFLLALCFDVSLLWLGLFVWRWLFVQGFGGVNCIGLTVGKILISTYLLKLVNIEIVCLSKGWRIGV